MGDSHRINGCTMRYGEAPHATACRMAHGPRVETLSYRKPGATLARAPSYMADGPRGVSMKGAGWRKETPRKLTRLQGALLACATRKISYDEPTVCIRKFPKEG